MNSEISRVSSDEFSRFKVAAVQAAPVYMDRDGSAEKACRIIGEAAKQGAKIIGFPECFIPGFPSWVYAASPNYDTIKVYEECVKNSVEIPGKVTEELCEAARQNGVYVVMGVSERDSNDVLYITQLFVNGRGEIIGKHRKMVPTYAEKLLFAGGDGSTLSVFKTEYGELGGLNCGEHYNPLARFALIAQNIKIHVASWPMPSGLFRETIIPCVRAYSCEGSTFVINSSAVVTPEIRERLLEFAKTVKQTYETDVKIGGGVGCIISPLYGRVLAQANPEVEDIAYAECDISDHFAARITHDIVGNYNRPEIFNLVINKRPCKLVETLEEDIDRLLGVIPVETRKVIERRASTEGKTMRQTIIDLLEAGLGHKN